MLESHILKEIELYEKEYDRKINLEVVEDVLNTFSDQGHSGFTASYVLGFVEALVEDFIKTSEVLSKALSDCTDAEGLGIQKVINSNIIVIYNKMSTLEDNEKIVLVKLLQHKPLTPLQNTEDEWNDISDMWGNTLEDYVKNEYQNKRDSSIFKTVYKNGIEIAHAVDDEIYTDDGGITFYTTGRFGRKQITFPYTSKEPVKIFVYQPDEDCFPIILTDSKTIQQVKDLAQAKYDKIDVEAITKI